MENIRSYLVEIMNDLDHIINNTQARELRQHALNRQRVYFALLDVLIRTDLDKNTVQYKEALAGLKSAEQATKKALEDVGQVASAIQATAQAAKLVDSILGGVFSL